MNAFNPLWLPKFLYSVMESITANTQGMFADAFFSREKVKEFVTAKLQKNAQINPNDATTVFLGVLQLYELCLRTKQGTYFFPRALPDRMTLPDWAKHHDCKQSTSEDYAELNNVFVPEQVLHRLAIRAYQGGGKLALSDERACRYGMIVSKHDCLAAFGFDRDQLKLWVHLQGGTPDTRQQLFEDLCDWIDEEWYQGFIEPEKFDRGESGSKCGSDGEKTEENVTVDPEPLESNVLFVEGILTWDKDVHIEFTQPKHKQVLNILMPKQGWDSDENCTPKFLRKNDLVSVSLENARYGPWKKVNQICSVWGDTWTAQAGRNHSISEQMGKIAKILF